MKRQDPDSLPSGILIIDKAKDMTSHDVVAIARGALKIRKIGHCGTLDPMATGVLVLLINKATKLQDRLMANDKIYDGTLTLGVTTDSQDAEGDVLETKPVPEMVSAIKKDGVRLYKLARQGKVVERKPRAVEVKDHNIHRFESPEVDFTVNCTKGFYVRTYAFDIGEAIGCGAHLSALRRTHSGKFDLSRSIPAMELKTMGREAILKHLISLEEIADLLGE